MKPSLARIIELQKFINQFQATKRVVHYADGVQENDVEHSYSLAMTAWFLAPNFPNLDGSVVIRYALVHDLVEIYAGDTFAYGDAQHVASKAAREAAALERIEQEWPDFPEMVSDIHDYESLQSAEAKFVYALDKVMPMIQIYLNDGYSWHKESITIKMQYDNKHPKVALSPEILPYFDELVALLRQHPELIKPR